MSRFDQNELLRNAEHHYDVHNFDDLYNYAVEVCLQNEPILKPFETDNPEAAVVRRLGARGLSNALAIELNDKSTFYFASPMMPDELGSNDEFITATFAMRQPERLHQPTNEMIQAKIMAFGEQILDEAYTSLGSDVEKMVDKYRAAETDSDQVAVLDWLEQRIRDLGKQGLDWENDYDHMFYHPVRLSPKALGQYPDNNLRPTCLGVSILAASFLRHAGAPLLHGGVMALHTEKDREEIALATHHIAQQGKVSLPDSTRQRLLTKVESLSDDMASRAFHATTLVRLKSGSWYVIDPNYDASYVATPKNSTKFQTTYETLTEMEAIAPGMEIPLSVGCGEISTLVLDVAARLKTTKKDVLRFTDVLKQATPETLQIDAYNAVRESIRAAKSYISKLDIKDTLWLLDREMDFNLGWRFNTSFEEGFSKIWESFFLQNETSEAILSRIERDPSYAVRRAEDLCTLPQITILVALGEFIKVEWGAERDQYAHERLELGLPAYRIGAAVLSDFASYNQNNLSYSFWASHWPSTVPLTEFLDQAKERVHEDEVAFGHKHWLDHFRLIYSSQYGIIIKSYFDQQ